MPVCSWTCAQADQHTGTNITYHIDTRTVCRGAQGCTSVCREGSNLCLGEQMMLVMGTGLSPASLLTLPQGNGVTDQTQHPGISALSWPAEVSLMR